MPTTNTVVTLDLAKSWLRGIANGQPDKVAKCNYATEADDGTFDPDCIIGVMLQKYFHIDTDYLAQMSTVFSACYQDILPYVQIDDDALFYMCLVQSLQDGAVCDQQNWSNAVANTDRAMSLIHAVGGKFDVDQISTVAHALSPRG